MKSSKNFLLLIIVEMPFMFGRVVSSITSTDCAHYLIHYFHNVHIFNTHDIKVYTLQKYEAFITSHTNTTTVDINTNNIILIKSIMYIDRVAIMKIEHHNIKTFQQEIHF